MLLARWPRGRARDCVVLALWCGDWDPMGRTSWSWREKGVCIVSCVLEEKRVEIRIEGEGNWR